MYHFLHYPVPIWAALCCAWFVEPVHAWSPTTPFVHVVTSEDKCFFVMRPAEYEEKDGKFEISTPASGTAYKVTEDGSFKKLWSVKGWYALPGDVHLSPDGKTLVHVRDREEFIGLDGRFPEGESQNVVTIYREGKPIVGYAAKDLIADMKKGIAFGWGGTWWVDRQPQVRPQIAPSILHIVDIVKDRKKVGVFHPLVFHLKTIEGTTFEIDLKSGKILVRKEKEPDPPSKIEVDPFGTDEAEQDGAEKPATAPQSRPK